jgi:hypothetical protein
MNSAHELAGRVISAAFRQSFYELSVAYGHPKPPSLCERKASHDASRHWHAKKRILNSQARKCKREKSSFKRRRQ